jgi:ribosomal protein L34E
MKLDQPAGVDVEIKLQKRSKVKTCFRSERQVSTTSLGRPGARRAARATKKRVSRGISSLCAFELRRPIEAGTSGNRSFL